MISTPLQLPAARHTRPPTLQSLPASYTRNALAVSRSSDPFLEEIAAHGSRADFLQALALLAGEAGVRCETPVRSGRVTVAIYVSEPYATWVRIFGQPRGIEDQYDPFMRMVFQTWVQECADGPITCIGHLCHDTSGRRCVTLGMVRFYETSLRNPMVRFGVAARRAEIGKPR